MKNKCLKFLLACSGFLFAASAYSYIKILVLGDSLTEGLVAQGKYSPYSNELQKLDSILVTNNGISGFVSKDINKSYKFQISHGFDFDGVIILSGTNDLITSVSAEDVFLEISSMYESTLEKGWDLFIMTIPQNSFELNRPEMAKKRAEINTMIRKFSEDHDEIVLFDFDEEISLSDESLWSDGVHLSEKGYKLLGEKITLLVKEKYDLEFKSRDKFSFKKIKNFFFPEDKPNEN